MPFDPEVQVAPAPFKHPESKLAGSVLAEVAVWKAASSFVQTTVLFFPITTVILSGL